MKLITLQDPKNLSTLYNMYNGNVKIYKGRSVIVLIIIKYSKLDSRKNFKLQKLNGKLTAMENCILELFL